MGLLFKILYSFTAFIQTLIVLRIFSDILDVNKTHSIVSWIVHTSELFISPFEGIVPSTIYFDNFELALTPIVALFFYVVVGFVFSQLAKTFTRTE